jgi:DNA polymerase/3'-5' exonuclease PolX
VFASTADTEKAIETLQSQVFLQQIKNMKGMGALSEKEGDRLAASVANLSLTQSPERLERNIRYIEETTRAAMEKIQGMGGAPAGEAAPAAGADVRAQADAILRGGK